MEGEGKWGKMQKTSDGKKVEETKSTEIGEMEKEEWLKVNAQEDDILGTNKKVEETNGDVRSPNKVTTSFEPHSESHSVHAMNFAKAVGVNDDIVNKKLEYIPTVTNDEGREIVIFDEEIVQEGCKKWSKTLCGHCVGFRMPFSEMKYHIMTMWRKFGIEDVFMNNCGVFFFKFGSVEHLEYIVENGPWMINSKPLIVQRWSPDTCIDMSEPSRLPMWVKMWNVPLEAWTVKGMSAIACRIGKPMLMDQGTARMCNEGHGRTGFSRVLIEVDVGKEFVDNIEISYQDNNKNIKATKFVKVEYVWKPLKCSHCNVFGHSLEGCKHMIGNNDKEEDVAKV